MAGGHRSAVHPAVVVAMTIHDIELICRDWLTLDEVAAVLGGSAESIRAVARTYGIEALGYPATWKSLHTIWVPKAGFINWYYHHAEVRSYGQDRQSDG